MDDFGVLCRFDNSLVEVVEDLWVLFDFWSLTESVEDFEVLFDFGSLRETEDPVLALDLVTAFLSTDDFLFIRSWGVFWVMLEAELRLPATVALGLTTPAFLALFPPPAPTFLCLTLLLNFGYVPWTYPFMLNIFAAISIVAFRPSLLWVIFGYGGHKSCEDSWFVVLGWLKTCGSKN